MRILIEKFYSLLNLANEFDATSSFLTNCTFFALPSRYEKRSPHTICKQLNIYQLACWFRICSLKSRLFSAILTCYTLTRCCVVCLSLSLFQLTEQISIPILYIFPLMQRFFIHLDVVNANNGWCSKVQNVNSDEQIICEMWKWWKHLYFNEMQSHSF